MRWLTSAQRPAHVANIRLKPMKWSMINATGIRGKVFQTDIVPVKSIVGPCFIPSGTIYFITIIGLAILPTTTDSVLERSVLSKTSACTLGIEWDKWYDSKLRVLGTTVLKMCTYLQICHNVFHFETLVNHTQCSDSWSHAVSRTLPSSLHKVFSRSH